MENFSISLSLILAASLLVVSIGAKPTENSLAATKKENSTSTNSGENRAPEKLDSQKIARNLVIPEDEFLVLSPVENQENYRFVPQDLRRSGFQMALGPQQVMVPVQQNHQMIPAHIAQNLVNPETYSRQVMVPVRRNYATIPSQIGLDSRQVMVPVPLDNDDDEDDEQEIMETAPTMTFTPLFAYRRIQAQRRRVYGSRRRNYGGHYGGFPTLA